MDESFRERHERLADLTVGFAANVQPGQVVAVTAEVGQEALTRALAASAYRHGARFVDVRTFDPWVKRARLLHAAEDTLDFVPPWFGARALELGAQRCARISLAGPVAPGLLDDVDPARAGRDALPFVPEILRVIEDETTNWTVVPCPTAAWASLVHPGLEPEAALARLWGEIAHVCRLDEPDPAAAWGARTAEIDAVARRLTERRFDALHFAGPGTDLTVGLLPSSRWLGAESVTAAGVRHLVNLPSEEVFTTPDPLRVDGIAAATKPLELWGAIVHGLRLRFEAGRAVGIEAESGVESLRAAASRDEGAARLGEVALVDRGGRVGPLGTVFYDTLLDENAASHVALGNAYQVSLGERDRPRANRSAIHVDVMIGADGVDVTGLTAAGERVPVLRGGAWQI